MSEYSLALFLVYSSIMVPTARGSTQPKSQENQTSLESRDAKLTFTEKLDRKI